MIYNYSDVLKFYNSDYQLKKALDRKEIYKIEKGVYCRREFVNYHLIINKKYPNAIFTLNSAFYYYHLTDVIPEKFYLATDRDSSKIRNKNINQFFVPGEILNLGKTTLEVEGVVINIYDKERLLIELIRNRKRFSFDYYKDIIRSYREIANYLDMEKIENYLNYFRNDMEIYEVMMREVF